MEKQINNSRDIICQLQVSSTGKPKINMFLTRLFWTLPFVSAPQLMVICIKKNEFEKAKEVLKHFPKGSKVRDFTKNVFELNALII